MGSDGRKEQYVTTRLASLERAPRGVKNIRRSTKERLRGVDVPRAGKCTHSSASLSTIMTAASNQGEQQERRRGGKETER